MPCARMFVQAEFNGIDIDVDRMHEVEIELRRKAHKLKKQLDGWAPGVNWKSPQQVAKFFFEDLKLKPLDVTPKGKPSTSESVLMRLAEKHPAAKALITYRGANQLLQTFIEGWKPYLVNGKLHPSFKLHGTVTGRLSCENPNLQQVPRDPLIRSLIISEPDWELLEVDLSQIELRIAAELAGDSTLLECFRSGIDVHWRTMLSTIHSGSEDVISETTKTAKLYLLSQGLPANGVSAKILCTVWDSVEERSSTPKLLEVARKAWTNQATGGGKRGLGPDELKQSLLEAGLSKVASKEVSEVTLRALLNYCKHLSSPQGRGSSELGRVEFDDALQVLSRIGPSIAEEFSTAWKELRKKAKAVGFGYLYGMWWKKFLIYARDNYGVTVTPQEAQASRESFFRLYSQLAPWHNRQRMFARRNGYVVSLSGRKRRLPAATSPYDSPERGEAERQAINSPVQSFANDLNLMAAIEIHRKFPFDVRICGTVHDAILMRVRKMALHNVVPRVLQIMSHPELLDEMGIQIKVPLEAEAKIGPWGKGISPEKYFKLNPP